jgi:hypothetical protein
MSCPYSLTATLIAFGFLAVVVLGIPFGVLRRDNGRTPEHPAFTWHGP